MDGRCGAGLGLECWMGAVAVAVARCGGCVALLLGFVQYGSERLGGSDTRTGRAVLFAVVLFAARAPGAWHTALLLFGAPVLLTRPRIP